jgi:beta-lactam-binding protein with PASTA domain
MKLSSEPVGVSDASWRDKLGLNGGKTAIIIHAGIIACAAVLLFLFFFFVYLPLSTHHGESVKVPDLTGKKLEDAKDVLDDFNLRYEVNDSNYVVGKVPLSVLSQYPLPGADVKTSRKIFLTIASQNPPMVKMPKLTELSPRSAESLLKSFDLQMDVPEYQPDLSEVVLQQMFNGKPIEPGTNVPKGAKIKLVIGDGRKVNLFTLEDFVGKTQEEARIASKGQNIQLNFRKDYSGSKPLGTVVRQNPTAGAQVKSGDVVDIWVASEKEKPKPDTSKLKTVLPDTVQD